MIRIFKVADCDASSKALSDLLQNRHGAEGLPFLKET
jgi:hypothetical protein